MRKKIIGIFIVMLLTTTAMTTIATSVNKENFRTSRIVKPADVPDSWLEGADQYQTNACDWGMVITSIYHAAQEFKPTKEVLTAVALYFFNRDAPSNIDITVSIRESLDGNDLTTKTINADDKKISGKGTWIMFDFDDITTTPEETYYIVCYANGGDFELEECYCWYFDRNNKYDRGIAWETNDSGANWYDLEDTGDPEYPELDICFITYFQEPPKNKAINNPFYSFLQQYPILYQLLQRFLKI